MTSLDSEEVAVVVPVPEVEAEGAGGLQQLGQMGRPVEVGLVGMQTREEEERQRREEVGQRRTGEVGQRRTEEVGELPD